MADRELHDWRWCKELDFFAKNNLLSVAVL